MGLNAGWIKSKSANLVIGVILFVVLFYHITSTILEEHQLEKICDDSYRGQSLKKFYELVNRNEFKVGRLKNNDLAISLKNGNPHSSICVVKEKNGIIKDISIIPY